MNPQFVVTGGAGFIGSQLSKALIYKIDIYKKILIVDHPLVESKRPHLHNLEWVPFLDHLDFINQLESGKIKPEIIVHLGACTSTTETNWGYLKENNLNYSQRLWNWCANNNCRFIYASSAATYGDGAQGFDDEKSIKSLRPLNLYAKSKHDFDLWAEAQTNRPIQNVGLKFFNVFGPGEAHKGKMASIVYHAWKQINEKGYVQLFKSYKESYADGGQMRDFIYVQDVVGIILEFIEKPTISGLFNVGTGHAHSYQELVETLFAALGREPRIEYIPMPDDLRGKYQYFTEATMQKIAKAGINYTPCSLTDAIKDYVEWLEYCD